MVMNKVRETIKMIEGVQRRKLAEKVANCLYGKNHKWETVDTIVDIIEILEAEGYERKTK